MSRWVRPGGQQYAQQQAPRQHQGARDRAFYLAQARQRSKQQRDYFDDDEEDEEDELLRETAAPVQNDDDDVDPLDAFMAGIAAEAPPKKKPRPERLDEAARDAVDDDQHATVLREQASKERDDDGDGEGEGVSYVDGRAVVDRSQKKRMAKLAPADHRRSYASVESCFVDGGLEAWNVSHEAAPAVSGSATAPSGKAIKPAPSFAAMFASPKTSWLLKGAARAGLERPTAVQALTVPAALCGCDVLAVAETGSGKTLAFGWPLLAHVAAQEASRGGEPVALVVVPTRELCEQVYRELGRHAKYAPRSVGTVAVFGGAGKWEMARELKKVGSDVVVATPGRMMEFVAEEVADLQARCSFLVVDEADRMFELGFQDQLTSLAQRIRPSRQAIFTTATLPHKVDGLVRSALCRERLARIVVGAYSTSSAPAATENVLQKTHILPGRDARLQWLLYALPALIQKGRVVVFCGRRTECEMVTGALRQRRVAPWTAALHGDVDGAKRSTVLTDFRNARGGVLVATDVAARGVDVKGVAAVVNYDIPSSMAQYVHRVGRTARAVAGDDDVSYGEAHTLLCRGSRDDEAFSKQLVNSLQGSTRSPPDGDLYKFAKMKPIVAAAFSRLAAAAAPSAFSMPLAVAPVVWNPLFAPPAASTFYAPPPTFAPPAAGGELAAAVEAARRIKARLAGGGS